MVKQFVLTVPLTRIPEGFKQKRYRKALREMAPWIKKVAFLIEGKQPVMKVDGEGDNIDQSAALSAVRAKLDELAVKLVYVES